MTAADLGRLPVPGTGDELDDAGPRLQRPAGPAARGFDRLNEALDRQRRFAGDASHQLRTPLAALLGQVQLARRRDRTPEEYRQVLDRVHDEGTRLRQIVESLLLLAQPDGTRIELEVVDLARLAARPPRTLVRPPAGRRPPRRGRGRPAPARAGPPAAARPARGQPARQRAASTARPGRPSSSGPGATAGAIVLGVEDRGRGLDACEREHVFEPFYRAEGVRRIGPKGAGLGLAVARRIAEALEGTLSVEGMPGGGNTFILRLAAGGSRPNGNGQASAPGGRGEEKFPGLPCPPGSSAQGLY